MTAKALFADNINQEHNFTAGELLRHTRELKELSQKEVASALNLMVSHIKAIETDRYNPAVEREHFLRYLNEYAGLLELDADKVVQLYSSPTHPDYTYAARPHAGRGLWVIAGLVVCSVLAWQLTRHDLLPGSLKVSISSAYDRIAPFVGGQADRVFDAMASVGSGDEVAVVSGAVERNDGLTTVPALNSGVDGAVASDFIPMGLADGRSQGGFSASANGKDELLFEFDADCWVEVFDANNKRLFMGQKHRDEELYLLGQAPFNVLVGYSRGVKLSINGKSVPIAVHDYSNSSRISVSQDAADHSVKTAQLEIQQVDQQLQSLLGSKDVVAPTVKDSSAELGSLLSVGSSTVAVQDKLQFHFTDDCWVEVYDRNSVPLVMKTKLAGEVLNITGLAPFEVRVGNSRAVSLKLNGASVSITQHSDIRSTELLVGQR